MRRAFLHIVAGLLKAAGFMVRVHPVKRRVALLSRQSSKMSLDFQLLVEKLRADNPGLEVAACLTDPETKDAGSFVGNTLRQLMLAQTSSVVVIDGYVPAVSVPAKRRGITVIQLWHALGALKKFGYQCLDTPYGRSSDSARILKMHRNYDYVIAGGSWTVDSFSLAFDCDRDCMRVLGLPRVDYLASDYFQQRRQSVRESILRDYPQLEDDVSTIVYAPTFRRGDDEFARHMIDEVLAGLPKLDCNLVVAGHPLEGLAGAIEFPIRVITGTGYRTIDLIQVADAVITDYSAIAYEAMIIGRPTYFFVPDIDEYRRSPGLNVDPTIEYPESTSREFASLLEMAMKGLGGAVMHAETPKHCTCLISSFIREWL